MNMDGTEDLVRVAPTGAPLGTQENTRTYPHISRKAQHQEMILRFHVTLSMVPNLSMVLN